MYACVLSDIGVDKDSGGATEGEKLYCTTAGGGKLLTIVYIYNHCSMPVCFRC